MTQPPWAARALEAAELGAVARDRHALRDLWSGVTFSRLTLVGRADLLMRRREVFSTATASAVL